MHFNCVLGRRAPPDLCFCMRRLREQQTALEASQQEAAKNSKTETAALAAERDELKAERDELTTDRYALALALEHGALVAQPTAIQEERDWLESLPKSLSPDK